MSRFVLNCLKKKKNPTSTTKASAWGTAALAQSTAIFSLNCCCSLLTGCQLLPSLPFSLHPSKWSWEKIHKKSRFFPSENLTGLSVLFSAESELFAWVCTPVLWPLPNLSPPLKPLSFRLSYTGFILDASSPGVTCPCASWFRPQPQTFSEMYFSRANTDCDVKLSDLLLILRSADCLQSCKLHERKFGCSDSLIHPCCLAHKYY